MCSDSYPAIEDNFSVLERLRARVLCAPTDRLLLAVLENTRGLRTIFPLLRALCAYERSLHRRERRAERYGARKIIRDELCIS